MARPRATVVVPIFGEAASVAPLSERLTQVLDAEELDWEVLFVDDGSADDTYEEITKLHAVDARYKCLRFSRNFGSHIAISAGLEHARGDLAIVITADLEEPPEYISEFLKMWRDGHHVVWGIRARRNTKKGIGERIYHRGFAWLAAQGPGQSEIGGGYFLADGRVLRAIRQFPERNRNVIGLLLWAGFKQGRLTYQPAGRKFGKSKWSLSKKIALVLDTFTGFSNRPLRVVFGSGLLAMTTALAALVVALIDRSSRDGTSLVAGPWMIVAGIAMVVGMQLLLTGVLGEYLWRALDEARRRPLYVVMDRLGLEADAEPR